MKNVISISPHAALEPFIKNYSIREIWSDEVVIFPSFKEHIFNFYIEGTYELHDIETGKIVKPEPSVIIGQQSKYNWQIRFGGKLRMISVQFYPTGLHGLLGLNMRELQNNIITGRSILGRAIEVVEFQIKDGQNNEQLASFLDAFFIQFVNRRKHYSDNIRKAVIFGIEKNGISNVSWIADQANLSVRQFERKFREIIGASPKSFLKKERFKNAFNSSIGNDSGNWTDIAYDAGYYDQAHFIKDFRFFTGDTPSRHFRNTKTYSPITY